MPTCLGYLCGGRSELKIEISFGLLLGISQPFLGMKCIPLLAECERSGYKGVSLLVSQVPPALGEAHQPIPHLPVGLVGLCALCFASFSSNSTWSLHFFASKVEIL